MNGLPLNPVTWQEAKAPDGRTYFYNTVTRETSWTKPDAMMMPLERALATQPWKEYSTPDGRKYYSNSQTKETVWDMPAQYRDALDAAQSSTRPPSQTPTFVAGGSTVLQKYNPDAANAFESRRSDLALPQISKEVVPDYSSFQEAEAAFLKLLKRSSVQPDWSWEQAMRATIKDPQYRALKDPKDRKAAFEKYAVEVRQQERERAKERYAKLRTDFSTMLKTHPEIRHYSRWKTIRPIIERETVFRAAESEDERKQLFEEYIVELKKQNIEQEATRRKSALTDLTAILKALNLEPYTRWSQAQEVLQSHERIQTDENFKLLSKSDILTAFESHIKSLERTFNDARQQQKADKARVERQNRDAFTDLLRELRGRGKLKANTKWKDLVPQIEADPRYVAMLGQSGSSPLDLFWDAVEEEESALRGRRNDVYDVLEDKRYEVTPKTTFDDFYEVVLTDRRTAKIDKDALELIFQRLREKILKRNEDDKHAADRQQRRAIDALRSRIKHLEPPVRLNDAWDDVKPRVEKSEEYRALDGDEARKSAFDKVIKRLKEKDEDVEHDRERRRARRGDEREYRNGHRDSRHTHGRLSRSPEADPYEADRRKAIAAREQQYRKNTVGLSPPRDSYRERDRDRRRDDRHGRLDRSPPRQVGSYDRDRRDREDERERLYRSRADPRGGRDELNYGDDAKSTTGSERRRRRESDGESVVSADRRSSKRSRREPQHDLRERNRDRDHRSGTPLNTVKQEQSKQEPPPEPAGVHSGSEEGEIEED